MKKVLYVIDDINYNSGAKAVTLLQMKQLQQEYDIYLLSLVRPKESIEFLDEKHVLEPDIWKITEIYAVSFRKALRDNTHSLSKKISRILYAISLRCGWGNIYFENMIKKKLKPCLEQFDTVIVVSEASKLRRLVSELQHPKKIQWIHTDYARWSEFSEWSRAVTKNDAKIYPKYDKIVVLSNHCKQGMVEKLPELEDKIMVISNLIDGDRILKMAKEPCSVTINENCLNLVTVARLDQEKRIDKLLELAREMEERETAFHWYVIGDGPERKYLEKKRKEYGLENVVYFMGHLDNPYPLMSQCDALVLLSKYEGTPVTIDEAMVLGIGVVAPNIGGIEEQLGNYQLKYLFDDKLNSDLLGYQAMSFEKQKIEYQSINNKVHSLIKIIL